MSQIPGIAQPISRPLPVRRLFLFAAVAGGLFLAGCIPNSRSQTEGSAEPYPGMQVDIDKLEEDDALLIDAAAFAEFQGITLEDALMRLEHQQTIGLIQPELASDLSGSYAGLWVEHEPKYRIVIALTEGDRAAVQPYLDGKPWAGLVEVQPASHTLLELKSAQAAVSQAAESLNIGASSSIDVIQNRVEVRVGNPDLFLADLSAAGINLPGSVDILPFSQSGPLPDTNQGLLVEAQTADGRTIYLPKGAPTDASMAALIDGDLVEVNGCLRVASEGYESGFLIIWPYESDLRLSGQEIEVVDGGDQVAARVGQPLRLGGGALESEASMSRYDEAIPGLNRNDCPGPYWIAGRLETLEEQNIADIYVSPFSSGSRILATLILQSRASEAQGTINGEFVVDHQGCIRVGQHVVFWPPGAYLIEDPLRLYSKNRQEIARIGEMTVIEGAEKTAADYRYFDNKMPCAGPYWGASD